MKSEKTNFFLYTGITLILIGIVLFLWNPFILFVTDIPIWAVLVGVILIIISKLLPKR